MEKNTKIIMILSAIICILLIWGSLFFADNYPQTFECDELKITTPIDGGYYDDSFGSLSLSDENQSNVIFIAIIPDSEEGLISYTMMKARLQAQQQITSLTAAATSVSKWVHLKTKRQLLFHIPVMATIRKIISFR